MYTNTSSVQYFVALFSFSIVVANITPHRYYDRCINTPTMLVKLFFNLVYQRKYVIIDLTVPCIVYMYCSTEVYSIVYSL